MSVLWLFPWHSESHLGNISLQWVSSGHSFECTQMFGSRVIVNKVLCGIFIMILCATIICPIRGLFFIRLHYILVLSHSGTAYDRFRVCADSSTHIRASIWQVPCVTNSSTLVMMVIWQFPRLWYWYYAHQNEYMTGSGRSRFVGVIVWVINFGSDVTLFNCLQPWMLTQLC